MLRWVVWMGTWLICAFNESGYAQKLMSTQSWSLGGAGQTMTGAGSVFGNPALLGRVEGLRFESILHSSLRLPELSSQAIAMTKSLYGGGVGVGLERTGIPATYTHLHAHLGFARRFGPLWSVGMRYSLEHAWVKNYPGLLQQGLTIGGMLIPTKDLLVGFSVGPLVFQSNEFSQSPLESSYWKLGLDYRLSKQVASAMYLRKQLHQILEWGAGLEVGIGGKFTWRMGFNNKPIRQYMGIGIRTSRWGFDWGVGNYPNLGLVSQWGLHYHF